MGSVQVGCLYSPLRRGELLTVNSQYTYSLCTVFLTANGIDHRFCQHHQPSTIALGDKHPTALRQETPEKNEELLDNLALVEYVDKQGHYNDALCNVYRSGIISKSKISTYGFLATFFKLFCFRRLHRATMFRRKVVVKLYLSTREI